jgi:hypothetical protein
MILHYYLLGAFVLVACFVFPPSTAMVGADCRSTIDLVNAFFFFSMNQSTLFCLVELYIYIYMYRWFVITLIFMDEIIKLRDREMVLIYIGWGHMIILWMVHGRPFNLSVNFMVSSPACCGSRLTIRWNRKSEVLCLCRRHLMQVAVR